MHRILAVIGQRHNQQGALHNRVFRIKIAGFDWVMACAPSLRFAGRAGDHARRRRALAKDASSGGKLPRIPERDFGSCPARREDGEWPVDDWPYITFVNNDGVGPSSPSGPIRHWTDLPALIVAAC